MGISRRVKSREVLNGGRALSLPSRTVERVLERQLEANEVDQELGDEEWKWWRMDFKGEGEDRKKLRVI